MADQQYAIKKTTGLGYTEAVEKVTEELKKEGFGVLTEIDVKATMKKKLDVDLENYVILGACNPPFALKALQAEDDIGLLLPCNVIVYEKEEKTIVAAINPLVAMQAVENPALEHVAEEVTTRLRRVVDHVG